MDKVGKFEKEPNEEDNNKVDVSDNCLFHLNNLY
jgi:hypothetical protein